MQSRIPCKSPLSPLSLSTRLDIIIPTTSSKLTDHHRSGSGSGSVGQCSPLWPVTRFRKSSSILKHRENTNMQFLEFFAGLRRQGESVEQEQRHAESRRYEAFQHEMRQIYAAMDQRSAEVDQQLAESSQQLAAAHREIWQQIEANRREVDQRLADWHAEVQQRRREQQHEELQRHVDETFEHLLALARHLEQQQQQQQQQPQEMVADEEPAPAIRGNRFELNRNVNRITNRNNEEKIQMNLRGVDEEVSDSANEDVCMLCYGNKACVVSSFCCGKRTTCVSCSREWYKNKTIGQVKCLNCNESVEHVVRVL